jgi:hypothetical protein
VDRQIRLLQGLPKFVEFGEFLSLKGYYFVLSVFGVPALIDTLVTLLRSLDATSLAFRQKKLIKALITCRNRNALVFVTNLCQCVDMSLHIARHNLPLNLTGFEQEALALYAVILGHQEVRSLIAGQREPLLLAQMLISEMPSEACVVLANYPFSEKQKGLVLQAQLLPSVAQVAETGIHALVAFHRLLVLLDQVDLASYPVEIATVLANHPEFAQDAVLMQKLEGILPATPVATQDDGLLLEL